jgi:hypothetical protein
MLVPLIAYQGLGDDLFACRDTVMAQLRQDLGITFSGQNGIDYG